MNGALAGQRLPAISQPSERAIQCCESVLLLDNVLGYILDCTSAACAVEKQMRYGNRITALLGSALMLSASVALGQVKTANQGISDREILVGTHQVLTGPGSAWGVPVANGIDCP
jgi:hypothetical protein